jgi:hypothetical protein
LHSSAHVHSVPPCTRVHSASMNPCPFGSLLSCPFGTSSTPDHTMPVQYFHSTTGSTPYRANLIRSPTPFGIAGPSPAEYHHRTTLLPNHLLITSPPNQCNISCSIPVQLMTGPTHTLLNTDPHPTRPTPLQIPCRMKLRRTRTLPGQIAPARAHQQLYTSKTPCPLPHSINRGAGVQQWQTSLRAQARKELSNYFHTLVHNALYL